MIFWDSSAVFPILAKETWSRFVESLLRADAQMVVWWGTSVEVLSAIARRERDKTLLRADVERAREGLERLADRWAEVPPSENLRSHANRVLLRHPLTSADALQLAAALTWSQGKPELCRFAALDERLNLAARREGFRCVLTL